jgi:hypothetical protein
MIEAKPVNLIGGHAYDSDQLDDGFKQKRHRDDRSASPDPKETQNTR